MTKQFRWWARLIIHKGRYRQGSKSAVQPHILIHTYKYFLTDNKLAKFVTLSEFIASFSDERLSLEQKWLKTLMDLSWNVIAIFFFHHNWWVLHLTKYVFMAFYMFSISQLIKYFIVIKDCNESIWSRQTVSAIWAIFWMRPLLIHNICIQFNEY